MHLLYAVRVLISLQSAWWGLVYVVGRGIYIWFPGSHPSTLWMDAYMTDCGGRKAFMTVHIVPRGILLGKYWEYAVKEFVGEMTIY